MRVALLEPNVSFMGNVYFKNPQKARKEIEKIEDTKVAFLEPAINNGLNACVDAIARMTPNNFNCGLDIKIINN